LEPLARDVARFRILVWGVIGAGLALFYGALSWVFRRASRTILGQKEALELTAADLRRAYQELQAAQARLVRGEQLASAGRLAAGLVHEIGNPLASLLGMVDLLGRCWGRPEEMAACRENLSRMAAEITRLKGILQGLLDYARPAEARREPVDMNRVVERTMVLVASQPTFRRIRCQHVLGPRIPAVVTDERQLQQVLVNVLLNAADAMPDGGALSIATGEGPAPPPDPEEVRAGRPLPPGVPVVWLTVKDTGKGIAPADMARIFEPFFTTKEPGRGAGLGLAICQALLEELGGELRVSSRPGAGTLVRILLHSDGREGRDGG
ncbi:MAG TPA: ATP-binding protein, partial [Candidatus Methylomirabilis sp.]|nr:ATP-binding protein [Candidatus Methylomirabilis sp.]